MKEQDYIIATNLAKMRIAYRTLTDALFIEDENKADHEDWIAAAERMQAIIGRLEEKVR